MTQILILTKSLRLQQTIKQIKNRRNRREAFIAPHALNQRSPAEGKGKGQKLLAQGNALGYMHLQTSRPVRAKALKKRW